MFKRLVSRLRERWPTTRIEIRADAGFALPSIYDEYCEAEGIYYTIRLIPNPRLQELTASLVSVAALGSIVRIRRGEEDPKMRLLSEGSYAAGSWAKERRVVYKVEILEKGTNTRFVVTNRGEPAQELYDRCHIERGETENRIKDYKMHYGPTG